MYLHRVGSYNFYNFYIRTEHALVYEIIFIINMDENVTDTFI